MNLGRMCSAVQLIKIHTLRTGTRQKRSTSGQERAMEGTANTYDNFSLLLFQGSVLPKMG